MPLRLLRMPSTATRSAIGVTPSLASPRRPRGLAGRSALFLLALGAAAARERHRKQQRGGEGFHVYSGIQGS